MEGVAACVDPADCRLTIIITCKTWSKESHSHDILALSIVWPRYCPCSGSGSSSRASAAAGSDAPSRIFRRHFRVVSVTSSTQPGRHGCWLDELVTEVAGRRRSGDRADIARVRVGISARRRGFHRQCRRVVLGLQLGSRLYIPGSYVPPSISFSFFLLVHDNVRCHRSAHLWALRGETQKLSTILASCSACPIHRGVLLDHLLAPVSILFDLRICYQRWSYVLLGAETDAGGYTRRKCTAQ